jgi:hypothetical protein
MPTPLQWDARRDWTFDVDLVDAKISFLRFGQRLEFRSNGGFPPFHPVRLSIPYHFDGFLHQAVLE